MSLKGTGNFAQAFQGRAPSGYSSFPLVASNGFNLQLEPPAINKGDVKSECKSASLSPFSCHMISLDVQELDPVATHQLCKSSPFIEGKKR